MSKMSSVYPLSADKQFMDDAACRASTRANHGHLGLVQQRADKPERVERKKQVTSMQQRPQHVHLIFVFFCFCLCVGDIWRNGARRSETEVSETESEMKRRKFFFTF